MVPGTGVTMARRVPVILLNNVDFPTLGRPTSTTVGRGRGATAPSVYLRDCATRPAAAQPGHGPPAGLAVDSVSRSIYASYRVRDEAGAAPMIKVDIVNEVSRLAEITKVKAELAVDAVFDAMRISMQRGERIELRGFGVFQVKPRKRGIGRNPRTGREVRIPPGRTIRFKPGKDLQNIG